MVDIRRRFELYVALTKILEFAAYLIEHLAEIKRDPTFQRYNRDRFESNPGAIYNLYAVMRSRIGEVHATTLFEMLDPLGWAPEGSPSEHASVVAAAAHGGDHGGR